MEMPRNLRVMVLDDDPFMLKLLARTLERKGFADVVTCDNGRDALTMVGKPQEAPDLIFCDINMPGMDGVQFVRHLVEHDYAGRLVLVSGEDTRTLQAMSRLVQAHRIEILGSLQKPVTPVSLEATMGTWTTPTQEQRFAPRRTYSADEVSAGISAGQMVNHYQPKVSLSTGRVVGVESLVRWQHPEDGLVYPDHFIGIAEEHCLIDALTNQVLLQALQDMARWKQAGLEMQVSVNVSMDNLNVLEFPDMVAGMASSFGIAPTSLTLEVTESQLMHDLRAPLEILTRLRLKRFGLSIDDFGTGHSSLKQLRDLPFDELKIDKTFVHGARQAENASTRAILNASTKLAKDLGMTIVAEGVEDEDDWSFLRSTGCDVAQGFYISRPIPSEGFVQWVDAYHRKNA